MKRAIISGTGVYEIPEVTLEAHEVETEFGKAMLYLGKQEYADLVFMARHGIEHSTPPHKINFQANLKALQMVGVDKIVAINAVGSINRAIPPGGLALLNDFLDFTSGRAHTFYNGGASGVAHTDMSQPYCPALRALLLRFAPQFELELYPAATYAATNGPRFESPAEIRMFAQLGGDVVGMTGVPEVTLAKELHMHYAAVAYSINWASGLEESLEFASADLDALKGRLLQLVMRALAEEQTMECGCENAVMRA